MKATATVNRSFQIGTVSRRMNSAHFEHAGRYVYNGVYEPGHPEAGSDGMRRDVLELVRELGTQGLRYPGGNFSSSYRWQDGIGPVERRPVRLDLAWRSVEPNRIGTDEIAQWAEKAGCKPMLTLNLGLGGVESACDWLEYVNFPGGTAMSDLRRANGREKPYDIRTWYLGNELDGEWQVGQMDARSYGIKAAQTAFAMKSMDPKLEMVLIGSSSPQMDVYPEFMREALTLAYDNVDYLSIHRYYGGDQGWDSHGYEDFLGVSLDMDKYVRESIATCDFVKAGVRSSKTMKLFIDEFAIWPPIPYERMHMELTHPWYPAGEPLAEGDVGFIQFLVSCVCALAVLRHADRVELFANLLTNICGPIRTEKNGPAWRQPTFYLMQQLGKLAGGKVLDLRMGENPRYDSVTFSDVPYVEAVPVWMEEEERLILLAVNRSLQEEAQFSVRLRGFEDYRVVSHLTTTAESPEQTNGPLAEPIRPRNTGKSGMKDGICQAELPMFSWNVIELQKEKKG